VTKLSLRDDVCLGAVCVEQQHLRCCAGRRGKSGRRCTAPALCRAKCAVLCLSCSVTTVVAVAVAVITATVTTAPPAATTNLITLTSIATSSSAASASASTTTQAVCSQHMVAVPTAAGRIVMPDTVNVAQDMQHRRDAASRSQHEDSTRSVDWPRPHLAEEAGESNATWIKTGTRLIERCTRTHGGCCCWW
jgi:hypothetical protein